MRPGTGPHGRWAGTAYDEDENATAIVPSTQMAPWSTQKMALGSSTFPLAHPIGWVHLEPLALRRISLRRRRSGLGDHQG